MPNERDHTNTQTPSLSHFHKGGPTKADSRKLLKAILKAACYECGVLLALIIIWSLGHARNAANTDSNIPPLWRLILWTTAYITVHVCVWRAIHAVQLHGEDLHQEPQNTR